MISRFLSNDSDRTASFSSHLVYFPVIFTRAGFLGMDLVLCETRFYPSFKSQGPALSRLSINLSLWIQPSNAVQRAGLSRSVKREVPASRTMAFGRPVGLASPLLDGIWAAGVAFLSRVATQNKKFRAACPGLGSKPPPCLGRQPPPSPGPCSVLQLSEPRFLPHTTPHLPQPRSSRRDLDPCSHPANGHSPPCRSHSALHWHRRPLRGGRLTT